MEQAGSDDQESGIRPKTTSIFAPRGAISLPAMVNYLPDGAGALIGPVNGLPWKRTGAAGAGRPPR